MRKNLSIGLGVSSVLALTLGAAVPALADIQPNNTDVVGVGSDTVQYVGDFLNDGATAGGVSTGGFNTIAKVNRIFSFDATSDAAGRAQYSATGNPTGATGPFPAAAVLRQSGYPLYRAQGSGDGIGDLIKDTQAHPGGPYTIDFARSSRPVTAAEQSAMGTALNPGCSTGSNPACPTTGIHVFQIASDGLDMAVNAKALPAGQPAGDPLTCMPASGVAAADLSKVYGGTFQTWGDLYAAGYTAPVGGTCASEPIVPMTASATKSGTGKDFFGDMKAAAAAPTTFAYDPRVVSVEEHDPSALGRTGTILTAGTSVAYGPQDIIAPFSLGRYNMIQTGYFDHVMDIHAAGTSTVYANTIALQVPGQNGVAATSYNKNRFLYIMVRDSAVSSTTPFLPGGAKNWVGTFFQGPTSWYAKSANAALFTAAGVTQAYSDLGDVSVG